jgi:hypothetical protein
MPLPELRHPQHRIAASEYTDINTKTHPKEPCQPRQRPSCPRPSRCQPCAPPDRSHPAMTAPRNRRSWPTGSQHTDPAASSQHAEPWPVSQHRPARHQTSRPFARSGPHAEPLFPGRSSECASSAGHRPALARTGPVHRTRRRTLPDQHPARRPGQNRHRTRRPRPPGGPAILNDAAVRSAAGPGLAAASAGRRRTPRCRG